MAEDCQKVNNVDKQFFLFSYIEVHASQMVILMHGNEAGLA